MADDKLTRLELTLFYRLLSVDYHGLVECNRMHIDRADLMARVLLLIVPPVESCEAHEARCSDPRNDDLIDRDPEGDDIMDDPGESDS